LGFDNHHMSNSDETLKWIEDQLRYNRDADLSDVSSGLIAILQRQQRQIDSIQELAEYTNGEVIAQLKATQRDVASNKMVLRGDGAIGFNGLMQEMRAVSSAVENLSREMAQTRAQFDSTAAENQRELERLSGEIKRTTVILFLVAGVLTVLVSYTVITGLIGF
jgi:hypothetical protein